MSTAPPLYFVVVDAGTCGAGTGMLQASGMILDVQSHAALLHMHEHQPTCRRELS